jgi:hypothetical protein
MLGVHVSSASCLATTKHEQLAAKYFVAVKANTEPGAVATGSQRS